MCVRVGHFADPEALPGLAHFLEHVKSTYTAFDHYSSDSIQCMDHTQTPDAFLRNKEISKRG